MSRCYRRIDDMKWVEIITLRSSGKINRQLVNELLEWVPGSDSPTDTPHLVETRIYHHSVVETDFSIHIYWKSEPGLQDKSPLGLRLYSALRNLGLLNHSVWVERPSREISHRPGKQSRSGNHFVSKSFGTSKCIIEGGDIMKQEKKQVQTKLEALEVQLKEWGVDLDKFTAKADKTKDKAKADLEREVAALRAKLNEAQKKLEELKKTGDDASGDLKKGVENAWAELKKAFDSATAKFRTWQIE
jgi:hypothetical protein